MPGAQETLSLNLPAKHYHALNTNAMSRVTVHAPADGFEAVIAQSFETRTVHLELRCPVHGVDVSLVLRTAERGYALEYATCWRVMMTSV